MHAVGIVGAGHDRIGAQPDKRIFRKLLPVFRTDTLWGFAMAARMAGCVALHGHMQLVAQRFDIARQDAAIIGQCRAIFITGAMGQHDFKLIPAIIL